jgi:glycosyltransferase involved in cell wall biosynthesis
VLDIPSPNLKKRLFKHTFLKILGNVDGFAFRSFSVKNLFLQNYDITGRPMTIAISGIPSSFIDPEPRFSYGKVPHIITSCKLRKQKNVHAVLDALAMLPKNLSWRYTIIGDGPERSALQKQVRHYQLESWVTFRGTIPREKNIQLMRQADIFIMISSSETLGMVYLEALAQGLLTIGSCNTGIDGFIHNKKNGFLCPPGDATSLAQTLMYVLKKHPMQIRENGYQTIINHGVQSTCSQNYLSFIANVLSRHIKK